MEQITKEDAAIIQLCDAIELYYKGRHISAITLAGAAEEILGRFATEKFNDKLQLEGTERVRQDYAEITADIVTAFSFEQLTGKTNKSTDEMKEEVKMLLKEWSKPKNALKHYGDEEEDIIVDDNFKRVAERHIGNAIINYKLYKNELPSDMIIQKYCRELGI